jgi:hypothetical protein
VSGGDTAAVVQALQAALAGEFAAVYGYGVVGAHAAPAARAQALRALAWHQAQQPVLSTALAAAGGAPVVAEPAYPLPFPVMTATAAARLAAILEQRVAATYADLVAAATDPERTLAADALAACAVRAAEWSGVSDAFPGLPERAGS